MVEDSQNRLCIVQGFEFDEELAESFNDDTIFMLGHLKREHAVYFQTDDGLETHETIKQLQKASEAEYFKVIVNGTHGCLVIELEEFEVQL